MICPGFVSTSLRVSVILGIMTSLLEKFPNLELFNTISKYVEQLYVSNTRSEQTDRGTLPGGPQILKIEHGYGKNSKIKSTKQKLKINFYITTFVKKVVLYIIF